MRREANLRQKPATFLAVEHTALKTPFQDGQAGTSTAIDITMIIISYCTLNVTSMTNWQQLEIVHTEACQSALYLNCST